MALAISPVAENWLQKKIMPRFEMHIMIAEKSEDKVETVEYELVCFVNDNSNLNEVESSANDVIREHLEDADNVVLFGTAVIEIKGKEVLNIAFQNKDADQDEVNSIMDLCTIGREIIH